MRVSFSSIACLWLMVIPSAAAPPATRNAFLIITDGLRWQEVFGGADERMISKDQGVDNPEALRAQFWRETPEERRAALMPFFWSTIATRGQVYGNRNRGSHCQIINPVKVSYPGYSENFCGFPSAYVDGNKKVWNPDVTVFEWLHRKPEYAGRVAAFCGWDLFPYIFNTRRAGFPVDCGFGDTNFGVLSERIETMNRVRRDTPYRWSAAPFDSFIFTPALEWMKLNKPRVMFLGLGETDEWAHEGEYDQYLRAAHRVDGYLKELWETLQTMPEYAGTTSLIITCDHGRGGAEGCPPARVREWRDHNRNVIGADETWIAVIGPDTPPLGERADIGPVSNAQIAATLAALLGEDYAGAEPRAGAALADALPAR